MDIDRTVGDGTLLNMDTMVERKELDLAKIIERNYEELDFGDDVIYVAQWGDGKLIPGKVFQRGEEVFFAPLEGGEKYDGSCINYLWMFKSIPLCKSSQKIH